MTLMTEFFVNDRRKKTDEIFGGGVRFCTHATNEYVGDTLIQKYYTLSSVHP